MTTDVAAPTDYTPPKIWTWDKPSGGKFASINRPVAGATFDRELPVGEHPLQLHSLGTPNGIKVTIMLEELLAATTITNKASAKVATPITTAHPSRSSMSTMLTSLTGGGGSRRMRDTRTAGAARSTLCLLLGSGLAMTPP